jgi:hypothetical protein
MSEESLRGVERYPFETTPPALHKGNWRTIGLSGQILERKTIYAALLLTLMLAGVNTLATGQMLTIAAAASIPGQ